MSRIEDLNKERGHLVQGTWLRWVGNVGILDFGVLIMFASLF